ncbi:MAG: single-stranded DNA-binding protein [Verrucomicrobiota bacterium JB022]|nr:single-stranded DNA-binding protein [Verrucomicrobiota bacterium JB022]
MANLNKVLLMGNLTRDPEKRVTPNGLTIVKLGMAVNRTFKSQDGQNREETTFVDIDAFGRQAEVIAQYCSKGRGLFVEGRLKLDQWQDQQGNNRSKLSVVLENFQFVGGRGDEAGGSSGGGSYDDSYSQQPAPSRSSAPRRSPSASSTPVDEFEDDVPF